MQDNDLKMMANSIRMMGVSAVEKTKSGHLGTLLGASDMMASLFTNFLNYNPEDPLWVNRDRFVLSAGHSCAMLYSTLHLLGYKHFTLDSLKNLRQIDSITTGHPEIEHEAGIEVTTGPLGEGVSMAVGLAIAERASNAKSKGAIDHFTVALVGEGCLMEGVSYEALSLAGHLGLNKLVVIYDKNNVTIDGLIDDSFSENIAQRMESLGFNVVEVDGHDFSAINNVLEHIKKDLSQNSNKPTFLISHTKIGFGCSFIEGKPKAHGAPIGEEGVEDLKRNLKWNYPDFEVPQEVKNKWAQVVQKNQIAYNAWQKQYSNTDLLKLSVEEEILHKNFSDLAKDFIQNSSNLATRVASGKVLEILQKHEERFIGGSADLSSSNNTINKSSKVMTKADYNGNYINYGIREHGMGAIMNGISAYGAGYIPYGGTFLVFSDFLRPAIRLSALMKSQVIYVFTHDNLSLGGDGPTHQPVEHIPSLRLIPNLEVLRPCDAIETIEAYLIALNNKDKPTALILGRNNVPLLRHDFHVNYNKSLKGAYVLKEQENAMITFLSNGSELHIAEEVSQKLIKNNISSRIVSIPSINRFKQQSKEYINSTLGNSSLNVVIKAARADHLEALFDGEVLKFSLDSFGASGEPKDVMDKFGFNSDYITNKILTKLKKV